MSGGTYYRINPDKPDAVARCDRSGQLCNYSDLVKQMQYVGSGQLVWTGLWVNKKFADIPNPALITPYLKPDPVPLDHPRPWQAADRPWHEQNLAPWDQQDEAWVGWGNWSAQS